MKIAGYIKNSLVDYPSHISCVIFLGGCNFNCWYCHNRPYIRSQGNVDGSEVLEFLKKRQGLIQGVVVSGGEPALNAELPDFMAKIKELGYPIKLDSNGSRPHVLKSLIEKGLVDYIAMDYKAPLEKYRQTVLTDIDIQDIKKSVEIIKNSSIDYEFRTTFIPTLDTDDILKIINELQDIKRYCLQQYRHQDEYCEILGKSVKPHSGDYIRQTADKLKEFFQGELIIRGL